MKNKISEMEAERERKNFEKMNKLRYNSQHLSDAQLRAFINDNSLKNLSALDIWRLLPTDTLTGTGEKIMFVLIPGILGLCGILFLVFQVFAVIEFFVSAVTFILSFGVIFFVAIVALIIFGIYFGLSEIDQNLSNAFLVTSLGGILAFIIFGATAYGKKEDGIKKMNQVRYNSSQLSDEELLNLMKNNSVEEFERIGYMAAFADRHSQI